ncbi:hypothetical protein EXU57_11995 [Segetibacter sp. 3557_3]|uniref:hypothetical protein n=1 Tax=Segetibacter sp. 3557_3 TaxID=2547429 RepID=UPI0010590A47|nr:hypothetical protein [Segetibacter sp. 3557_3]TDH26204.1 hypothetical protein EXU57_11995 [Segetibacter sp. 3557_3]
MNADKHLHFISLKIIEIGIALFHCHVNSVLRLPTSVINTLKIDEAGNIYILMPRPRQELSQFEKEFPVSLNYFKKGKGFFVNVFGRARIINDPEELQSLDLSNTEINEALNDQMLVLVKIHKADYYEKDVTRKNRFLAKMKTMVYNMLALVEQDEKRFDFSTSRSLQGYGF